MYTTTSHAAPDKPNQMLDRHPGLTEKHFVYREAPWIDGLLVGVLVIAVNLLGLIAVQSLSAEKHLLGALFTVGAGLMLYGALNLYTNRAAKFICSAAGIYFPAHQRFSRTDHRWLFVPWENIQEYRVQRMLDETSSHGLILSIRDTSKENRQFLRHRRTFSLNVLNPAPTEDCLQVCFSSVSPHPVKVLTQLRKYDPVRRVQTQSHHYQHDLPLKLSQAERR